MPKKILLTGGAGYIGSHVAHLLIDKGFAVTIVDSLVTGTKSLIPKKAKLIVCDISNIKKITKVLKQEKFELAIHFAGLIRVDESVKKPKKYYEYNYTRAKIFFDTCIKNGLNKFVFSSTAAVYGNSKKDKVNENSKLKPLNPYSKSKLKLENYLKKKSNKNLIKFVILRYFNVAGADIKLRSGLISKYSTHLIKVLSEVMVKKRKKLIINGEDYNTPDGTPIRDYIHVSDLADIHLICSKYIIKNKSSKIFNCGYGVGYSVKEVISKAVEISKKNLPIKIGKRRKGDSKKIVADNSKFKKYFKWKPKYNNLGFILTTAFNWEKKLTNKKKY